MRKEKRVDVKRMHDGRHTHDTFRYDGQFCCYAEGAYSCMNCKRRNAEARDEMLKRATTTPFWRISSLVRTRRAVSIYKLVLYNTSKITH